MRKSSTVISITQIWNWSSKRKNNLRKDHVRGKARIWKTKPTLLFRDLFLLLYWNLSSFHSHMLPEAWPLRQNTKYNTSYPEKPICSTLLTETLFNFLFGGTQYLLRRAKCHRYDPKQEKLNLALKNASVPQSVTLSSVLKSVSSCLQRCTCRWYINSLK